MKYHVTLLSSEREKIQEITLLNVTLRCLGAFINIIGEDKKAEM